MKFPQKKIKHPFLLAVSLILLSACFFCAWYLTDYYHADQNAIAAFSENCSATVQSPDDRTTVYIPENPSVGLIFYPGGKVEPEAYEPLLRSCAQEGILCVLVEMPFHLAVLDINAAQDIPEQFPEIQSWYLGGHSLGGSMACAYLEDHHTEYDGVVLLGSYSTADLSGTQLEALSIYGSEDLVLNRNNYEKNRSNLPKNFSELVLDGGCHAYFGVYGPQNGDGTPTLSNKEQISLTAQAISQFILN